jgi:uncharacterized protein (TIGR02145 family)
MKTAIFLKLSLLLIILIFLGCSKERAFIKDDSGSFTDKRDDQSYAWVKIGDQIWMAENLAYLPEVSPLSADISSGPCFFVFGYTGTDLTTATGTYNYKTYGVLYNWSAATTACPDGWHLPSDDEWEQLANYVNNQKGPYIDSGDKWEGLGKHLKANGGWKENGNGTDDFGFSGLPGGYLAYPNSFYDLGNYCCWWSATKYDDERSWDRSLSYDNNYFSRSHHKDSGFSVRCLRD